MDAPVYVKQKDPVNAFEGALTLLLSTTPLTKYHQVSRRVWKTYIRPQYVGEFSFPDGP